MVGARRIVLGLCALLHMCVGSGTAAPRQSYSSTNHLDLSDLLAGLSPVVSQCSEILDTLSPLLQRAAPMPCWCAQSPSAEVDMVPSSMKEPISENTRHSKRLWDPELIEPRNSKAPAVECMRNPTPVEDDEEPMKRACARSCLQLRDQADSPLPDGVYWLTGLSFPVYCDMSHDGGGWTLLLTSVSKQGWDVLTARERNPRSPSLTDNYSILRHANELRDLGTDDFFSYRIEAQAEKGRQRWGGIWLAPRAYSFIDTSASQTDVHLVRQFDAWGYKDQGIEKRMPWLNTRQGVTVPFVLSTTAKNNNHWWGTLVTSTYPTSSYLHSPWIHNEAVQSGTVLYWMREDIE